MTTTDTVIIRELHRQDYLPCWQAMKDFTNTRTIDTLDELWLVEHNPVFTQGQNGKPEHVLDAGDIPIIPVDRGGQVTYHGPGQWIVYTLIDVKRKKFNIRELVTKLENAVVEFLASFTLTATTKCDAPGVYVDGKKICSVGLRIRKGCSYHGLAFNIDMDLTPYLRINPCGYAKLEMTQLSNLIADTPNIMQFIPYLCKNLGYTTRLIKSEPWHGT